MLGNKLTFNPNAPVGGMTANPRGSRDDTIQEDTRATASAFITSSTPETEKNYESIVSEKTSVINKKKPKLRQFNSNLSAADDKLSMSNKTENRKTDANPFDKKKEEKMLPATIKEEPEEIVKELENLKTTIISSGQPKKNIANIFDDEYNNSNSNSNLTGNKKQVEPKKSENKLKTNLFDFDDSEVKENNTTVTSSTAGNKPQDKGKGPSASKIKFLFDDD
jgi:hypothetical protein